MTLLEELEQLRSRMSWFRPVALHVHSPLSHDWGRGSTDPEDNRAKLLNDPAPYFSCLERYHLVAITDHMKTSFAAESCKHCLSCIVLPGVELNVQLPLPWRPLRLHFVAIFPPDAAIDRVFHGTDIPPDEQARTGQEILKVNDVRELAERVRSAGGLLIAAHVGSDRGHRAAFRHEGEGAIGFAYDDAEVDAKVRELGDRYKEHIAEAGIDAVEIQTAAAAEHYRFNIGPHRTEIPTLVCNDAHTLEELRTHPVTYVKMTELSLSGLRQAFRFPDTRIRHAVPERNLPSLSGLRIAGSQGAMSDLTIGLSPNLTCLVGARGAGKSAIVDALRYTFGYNRTLGDEIGPDLAEQVKKRQLATLKNATVELIYHDASTHGYRIVADYNPKSDYSTTVSDTENNPKHVDDVERDGRFPCRLYGWSEIERLGRDAPLQRALIDRVLDLHGALDDRTTAVQKLTENRSQIEAMAVGLERTYSLSRYLQRLKEYRDDLELISKPEVDRLFKSVDSTESQVSVAKKWEQEIARFIRELPKAAAFPLPELGSELGELWAKLDGERLVQEFDAAAKSLRESADAIYEKVKELHRTCQGTRNEAIKELTDEVSGKGDVETIARKRASAAENLRRAEQEKREYETQLQQLRTALRSRAEQVQDLSSLCASLTENRRLGIDSVNAVLDRQKGPRINVVLADASDTDAYGTWLYDSVGRNTSNAHARRRISSAVKDSLGPAKTVQAMLQSGEPDLGLTPDDRDVLRRSLCPFTEEMGSGSLRVNPAVLDVLLQCNERPVDDLVAVTLDARPIGDLSPGQRCSALLPIIVLGSNVPLVVDQPEDNLDNQLVTGLLISILHDLKEKRQIILVTHNPNIVVSGDAEQVVVMDYVEGKCVVRRQGSLDNADIMRDVVELMEGGREAFVRRFKRYWPGKDEFRLQDLLAKE